jgi:hypothetical protein
MIDANQFKAGSPMKLTVLRQVGAPAIRAGVARRLTK